MLPKKKMHAQFLMAINSKESDENGAAQKKREQLLPRESKMQKTQKIKLKFLSSSLLLRLGTVLACFASFAGISYSLMHRLNQKTTRHESSRWMFILQKAFFSRIFINTTHMIVSFICAWR
jgi:hypothetical protein